MDGNFIGTTTAECLAELGYPNDQINPQQNINQNVQQHSAGVATTFDQQNDVQNYDEGVGTETDEDPQFYYDENNYAGVPRAGQQNV